MTRHRLILATNLLALLAALFLPPPMLLHRADWILSGLTLSLVALLPARAALASLLVLLAFLAGLSRISAEKAALTQLPLTMMDLRIALANPRGLADALAAPAWLQWSFVALSGFGVAAIAGFVVVPVVRARAVSPGFAPGRVVGLALLSISGLFAFGARFVPAATAAAARADLWQPSDVASFSRELGVLPFLLYSSATEATGGGNLMRGRSPVGEPPADQVAASVARFVGPRFGGPDRRPNIVVLLLESTFDVDAQFEVTPRVASPLVAAGPDVAARGALRVNAVGGGTWISEFESITGLDSRIFGYWGYYTHSAVAPFVRRSLATHLREKGYRTVAYYPTEGKFFNARNAYGNYGFETFVDTLDLGVTKPWRANDVEIAGRVADSLSAPTDRPLFAYALTIENHAPHPCRSFASPSDLPHTLKASDDFSLNCPLNEYIRRQRSTERAVIALETALRDLEARTGRPYLLVLFGDHLPHTFTATADSVHSPYDYSRLRLRHRNDLTFFSLRGSARSGLRNLPAEVPATLLPTLISAFVADRPDDLFLGVNFYLLDRCGPDAFARGPAAALGATCRQAVEAALSSYARQGLTGFSPS